MQAKDISRFTLEREDKAMQRAVLALALLHFPAQMTRDDLKYRELDEPERLGAGNRQPRRRGAGLVRRRLRDPDASGLSLPLDGMGMSVAERFGENLMILGSERAFQGRGSSNRDQPCGAWAEDAPRGYLIKARWRAVRAAGRPSERDGVEAGKRSLWALPI